MKKIVSTALLLSASLSFAATPNPYLSVNNMTKGATAIVSYETENDSGQLTITPGMNTGIPMFPNGEKVKNINFVLLNGKLIDKSTCGFVFDQLYNSVSIKFEGTMFTPEGENVTATCTFN